MVYLKGDGTLSVSLKHWITTIQFYAVKRSVRQLRGRLVEGSQRAGFRIPSWQFWWKMRGLVIRQQDVCKGCGCPQPHTPITWRPSPLSHLLLLIRVSRVELEKDIISLVFGSKSQDSGKQQKD